MSQSLNSMMDAAIVELAVAGDQLALPSAAVQRARSDETTCINRVNMAQKKFDDLVAMVKKSAPRESDWKRPKVSEA